MAGTTPTVFRYSAGLVNFFTPPPGYHPYSWFTPLAVGIVRRLLVLVGAAPTR